MTHLLDTSAILAYYFEKHGADPVQALLADTKNPPAICCITELEFWARLKSLDADAHFQSDWRELSTLLKTLPLDAIRRDARWKFAVRALTNCLPWIRSLLLPHHFTAWL
jgi:PIN domain nuclease of toxin-antitoxin system